MGDLILHEVLRGLNNDKKRLAMVAYLTELEIYPMLALLVRSDLRIGTEAFAVEASLYASLTTPSLPATASMNPYPY